jgi:hypothetical protein
MDDINLKRTQEKYLQLYEKADHQGYNAQGGIFTKKKRQQLLGLYGQSGRDRTKYDFWYNTRKYVETALIDLRLFIETSDKDDVNKVITEKALDPIFRELLNTHVYEPDSTRAKIAQSLIDIGFRYLQWMNRNIITDNQKQIIFDANQLSKQLTAFLLPESERRGALFLESH